MSAKTEDHKINKHDGVGIIAKFIQGIAMNAATAEMLARYNLWSDKVLYDSVMALPDGEQEKPRTSLFRNMVHTLNHIYVINRIWQAHLEGREHGYDARNTKDYPPLAELWMSQQSIDQWYVDWSQQQTDASLAENVNYTLIGGNQGSMTRGEILLHIVMHTNYHRGYVGDMMFQVSGHRAPSMDLPVYVGAGRPVV